MLFIIKFENHWSPKNLNWSHLCRNFNGDLLVEISLVSSRCNLLTPFSFIRCPCSLQVFFPCRILQYNSNLQSWYDSCKTQVPSMIFYPDFILILSRFYPDFIQILSRFYPDFLKTHFILILSRFYPNFWKYLDKIRIKSG